MSLLALLPLTLLCLTLVPASQAEAAALDGNNTQQLSAYDVLLTYDFPVGLLPQGVTGYELDESSGKFKAYLSGSCSFSISGYKLKYKSTISGVITKGKLSNLKGISVKILLFWVNIVEVKRSGEELQFSVGIASADFVIDNFVESPQCGCGFDCVNDKVRSIRGNPFVLSS